MFPHLNGKLVDKIVVREVLSLFIERTVEKDESLPPLDDEHGRNVPETSVCDDSSARHDSPHLRIDRRDKKVIANEAFSISISDRRNRGEYLGL